jgi:hypothetical protein
MSDHHTTGVRPAVVTDGCATVTDLATRRLNGDVLRSITLVFGGVNYGTLSVSTPYTKGKPIALYVVPQSEDRGDDVLAGPLDCLVTDDLTLAAARDVAR